MRQSAILSSIACATAAFSSALSAESTGLSLTPQAPAAPTFQQLMDPKLFPNPQRGMVVESAKADGGTLRIRTTGADVAIATSTGQIEFHQRIGHPRPVAVLSLGKPLQGAKITRATKGLARVTADQPKLTIRVNGDSLFMLHVHEPMTVRVERKIAPAWDGSFGGNHLIADEWGAFGLYCSELEIEDRYDAYGETVATYPLPKDAVLWVGVCPPKPYDWERSIKDNVVWHWSRETSYPPDNVLRSWKQYGNIVLLQSEVMLWKDWNVDFVPRLGMAEWQRVRNTIHDCGMRFIVYTSPYYFLKGTALAPHALNSFENFKGWPPGTPTGENMGLFMPAIRKVMHEYKPDGLYFDGQYTTNPAALYALARATRALIGEDGIHEWHSTGALGSGQCYLPQADAYVDFILRGEGRDRQYGSADYLRFFVSGYNINNCIGVLCNNGPTGVTPELAREVLKVNARFHTIVSWLDKPEIMRALDQEYRAKLTPALRDEVDRLVDARQELVSKKAAAMKAEQETIARPPRWGKPICDHAFDAMPEAKQAVSPKNPDALSIAGGSLHVRAHANTFAFLRIPLKLAAGGFVVKIRQGSDGGQSWGPGAMLRWPDGQGVRVGTRSDGTLQADVLGTQFHGGSYDAKQWVWLRARWLAHRGVVERSDDGKTFRPLWTFENGGTLNGETAELLVGKVPYSGEPQDYQIPGDLGECDVDLVAVYPR
ncbi:MAG: hypothetical protein JXQ73_28895 [Phycisphaerae bacterium]|nr:hypothetical protein [Phycisphaerae bacterium]